MLAQTLASVMLVTSRMMATVAMESYRIGHFRPSDWAEVDAEQETSNDGTICLSKVCLFTKLIESHNIVNVEPVPLNKIKSFYTDRQARQSSKKCDFVHKKVRSRTQFV